MYTSSPFIPARSQTDLVKVRAETLAETVEGWTVIVSIRQSSGEGGRTETTTLCLKEA